jgi:hypothetical protein
MLKKVYYWRARLSTSSGNALAINAVADDVIPIPK